MAATVTIFAPSTGITYSDTMLRPHGTVSWTGGTGPFDCLHEWDTVNTFDSGALIQDSNTGVTSPDEGTPPSDMGPAGTTWYYRAKVTDSIPSTGTSSIVTIDWATAESFSRWLYLLANVGVGFDDTDDASGTTGYVSQTYPDGALIDFDRWLYLLANVGVGFEDTDDASGDTGYVSQTYPDGNIWEDFARYLYLLGNVIQAYRERGWRFTYTHLSQQIPTRARSPRTWT